MTRDWGRRDPRWTGIRTATVRIAGRPVRVLRAEGTGTPHVLLHGLGGSATNWLDVAGGLARHGPVVAPDLPGFGATPVPPGGGRLGAQVAFVAALCRRADLEQVVLHGSSMGGLIALLVAAEHPGLVRRLVLVAPALPLPSHRIGALAPRTAARFAPFLLPGAGRAATRLAWRALTPEQLWAAARDFVYAHPERLRPAVRDLAVADYRRGRRLAWRARAFATGARSLVLHLLGGRRAGTALGSATAPTLVLWGAEDALVPAAAVETAAARRPDWTVRRVPATGHVVALESPGAYLRAVGSWLSGPGG